MFQTIKLPYTTSKEALEYVSDLQRQYSNVFRVAFNNCLKYNEIIQKEQRDLVKNLNNIDKIDSWWLMCCVGDASGFYEACKANDISKVIFGGKSNFHLRQEGKISKEKWKELRMRNFLSCGEKHHSGNRKFKLKVIEENKIIFQPKRGIKFDLYLPKLRKHIKKILFDLQIKSEQKQIQITFSLSKDFIFITFENKNEFKKKSSGKYAGLDLNPNYISMTLFNEEKQRIKSFTWNLSKLTIKSREASNSNKSKYLENKLKYETLEISKKISQICSFYHIDFVFLEDLEFKNKLNGKALNRLCRNKWKKGLFIGNLKKRLDILNIKWFEINPAYSSMIGNIVHSYPDPVNASIEIARRGYECIIKKTKQFYPDFKLSSEASRWKDLLQNVEGLNSWKEVFNYLKNSKVKYRVSWSEDHVFREFKSRKSNLSYIFL